MYIAPVNIIRSNHNILFFGKNKKTPNNRKPEIFKHNNTHKLEEYYGFYDDILIKSKKENALDNNNKKDNNKNNSGRIIKILSFYDYAGIVNNLLVDGFSSFGNNLIEIEKNDENKVQVHMAIEKEPLSSEYDHFYYSKRDFIAIMQKVKNNVSKEYPQHSENYKKLTTDLFAKL